MRLLRNIAIFSVVDMAGLAIGLLTAPITTRLLTIEQYGALPLLNAVWGIVSIVQFAGMDSAFILYQARHDHDRRTIIVTSTLVATVAAGVIWFLFAAFSLMTPWLSEYAHVSRVELAGFLLWMLASTLVSWQLQLLRFMHEAVRFARITLIGRIASVLVAIPVMYALPQEYRLAASLYTYAAFSWISLMLAIREVRLAGNNAYDRSHYSAAMVRPMMILGTALIPGALVYSMCSVTDRLLLGWYSNPSEVAIFSLAGAMAGVALVLKLAFSRSWDPHMVDWISTGDEKVYLPRLQAATEIIAPVALILTLMALVWGDTLVRIIFPAGYAGAGKIMPVLVLAGTLSTLGLVAIATETISGKARYRLPIYVGGLFANIVICMVFIPRYGPLAAAYGTLAGEAAVLLLWGITGRWILGNLKLQWRTSVISLMIAFVLCLTYRPGSLSGAEITEQVIVTIGCLICALAFGRVAMRKLRSFSLPESSMATVPLNTYTTPTIQK
jgi:O-antigen/teichoic acid export membrane protein